METNCSITKYLSDYINRKRFGITTGKLEDIIFVSTYVSSCTENKCVTEHITQPCETTTFIVCRFIIQSLTIQGNTLNSPTREVISASINQIGGVGVISYIWEFDSLLLSLDSGTINDSVIKLKWNAGIPLQAITKLTCIAVDINGCPSTKSCYLVKPQGDPVTQDCSGTNRPCANATGFGLGAVTSHSIDADWDDTGLVYDVKVYKVAGNVLVNTYKNALSTLTIDGLSENTSYRVDLISHCPNGGIITQTATISTGLIPCGVVSFTVDNITATEFTINFPIAIVCQVSLNNGSTFSSTFASTNSITYSGLTPSTTYHVIVRRICPNGATSTFGPLTVVLPAAFCNPIPTVDVVTGMYNSVRNTYPITISWAAQAGVTDYRVGYTRTLLGVPAGLIATTANTFFTFEVDAFTSFEGNVSVNCSNGASSTDTNFRGDAP